MRVIVCVICLFIAQVILAAEDGRAVYLKEPLQLEGLTAQELMERADAMRYQVDHAWVVRLDDGHYYNWKGLYKTTFNNKLPAAGILRFEFETAQAVEWLLQLQGNQAYRVYLDDRLLIESDYQKDIERYQDLSLSAGAHRIDVVSVWPVGEKRWHTGLRYAAMLEKQFYHDAAAAGFTVRLPSTCAGERITLQAGDKQLAQLAAVDGEPGLFKALVPYHDGGEHYHDASLQVGARQRLPVDLTRIEQLRDFEAKTAADIQRYRTATLRLQVEPGVAVSVCLKRHAFSFGTAIAHNMFYEDEATFMAATARGRKKEKPSGFAALSWKEYRQRQQQYQDILKRYFNAAVHENALKWYHVERRQGVTDLSNADRALRFCEAHDLPMRGHCLFWEIPKYTTGWRRDFFEEGNKELIEAAMQARAIGQTWYYRGRIDEWDLNNEMLHGRMYRDLLGDGIVDKMAAWARVGNPNAVLYLNDYAILSGKDGDAYVEQIRSFLDAGIPIGGIGCQAHFWSRGVDVFHVHETLDKLAQFGLPIKATEFDVGGSPEDQARDFIGFYRTLFAHPGVDGVLMWGFWAGKHWRSGDAPWAEDFTPRPAALAYITLITEDWHTSWQGTADAEGTVAIPHAYYGLYDVIVDGEPGEHWHRKTGLED